MMEAPCHNCPDRRIGCHSTCGRYKDYKVHNDGLKAARNKEKFISELMSGSRQRRDKNYYNLMRELRR